MHRELGNLKRRPRRLVGAFTLIELLTVLGVIAILAGLILDGMRGARRVADTAQARADLTLIAQGLEAYRREYGEYPLTAKTPIELREALLGRLAPKGAVIARKRVLDDGRLTLREPGTANDAKNSWVDPWGRDYQYVVFTRQIPGAAPSVGYVLFSCGERGANEDLPSTEEVVAEVSGMNAGVIARTPRTAANIYATP
ncbi:MAG: type secretion pathway protein XcpT [Verrucomicrobia bacterium]|nr:type secretion pathway protein XcpT [Verrucomicrobiota bacterium]